MKDWSQAEWVDPSYHWKPLPERMLIDYATKCNLRCPMCMVWGWEQEEKYADLLVPFCKDCNGWLQYEYEEEIRDDLLIRRSPEFIYYNKIDRLKNRKGTLLGGHKPPPIEVIEMASACPE